MKFTIVFPSRERLELLSRLIKSICITTMNHKDIEVFIAVDDDDTPTQELITRLYGNQDFIKMFVVPRSKDLNFSRDYYNYLARKGTGKYIIAINDDCTFETMGWDDKAWEALEAYVKDTPTVVHGWIADGLDGYRAVGHGIYCCFPLVGRDGFNALGGCIFPERIPNWGADIWMRRIYDSIGRVVVIPMMIRHHCHHNKTREQDEISKRITKNQVGYDVAPTYDEINALLAGMRPTAKVE